MSSIVSAGSRKALSNVVGSSFHVVGDAFVDLFCFLEDNLPPEGGDARLRDPVAIMAGGSAVNTATHLAALEDDIKVTLHTVVNPDDEYGRLQLEHARKYGLQLVNCAKHDSNNTIATGHCVVMVSKGGSDRSFMTHSGCMQNFEGTDLNVARIVGDQEQPLYVHVAGYYNIEGFWDGKLCAVLQRIRQRRPDCIISLVPQYDASGHWKGGLLELMPLLDVVILNELEAQNLCKSSSDDTVDEWTTFFTDVSPSTCVVVTRGKLGALAIYGGSLIAEQPALEISPVDPTGAGDAFASGFLYGIASSSERASESGLSEEHIQTGLVHGVGIASCSVLTRGASVPSARDAVDDFVRRTQLLTKQSR